MNFSFVDALFQLLNIGIFIGVIYLIVILVRSSKRKKQQLDNIEKTLEDLAKDKTNE